MGPPSGGGTRRKGLVIFDDDKSRLQHWDGTRWLEEVTTVSGSEINLTTVNANVDTTADSTRVLTAPPSGLYRVSVYSTVTTAFSSNQAVPAVKVWWYGEGSEHSKQLNLGTKPTLGTEVHEVMPVQITGGHLHYQVLGFATGSGALSLRIRVEALH